MIKLVYKHKITEIFKSISGESVKAGLPSIFVRLYGCNIRCSWCDSSYSCTDGNYSEMTSSEILAKIEELLPVSHIIITGGEPLVDKNLSYLICDILENTNCTVEVETNGTYNIVDEIIRSTAFSMLPLSVSIHYLSRLTFTVDYKCPSSDVESSMKSYKEFAKDILELEKFTNVVVKFVVKDYIDLAAVHEVCKYLCVDGFKLSRGVYISPVFGANLINLVDRICEDNVLCNCRFQLQLHKYIWNPEKRGV